RPLHGLQLLSLLSPAVNCWATIIRPLCGLINLLFGQSQSAQSIRSVTYLLASRLSFLRGRLLFLRHFSSLFACFRQSNRDCLLLAGHFLSGPALQGSLFALVHCFLNFLLRLLAVLCHFSIPPVFHHHCLESYR